MSIQINQSIGKGIIKAPPSKSYAHRLLIAGALSNKKVIIKNVILNNDIKATINCLKTLGKKIIVRKDMIYIDTVKPFNKLPNELVFNCLESGSTLRFFIPLALTLNRRVKFIGSKRLIERGIDVYLDICKKQNIEVTINSNEIIFEGVLKSDNFIVVGNISSQFISGLLFTLPLLKEESTIEITTNLESKNYIDITLDVLKKAHIDIEHYDNKFIVKPNQQYILDNETVEGDYSNAAFLDALNYLDGEVIVQGLNESSYQGDKIYKEYFEKLSKGFVKLDISQCIDLGPILFCMASLKHGAHFTGTKRLTIKESNRIKDLEEELNKFGVLLKVSDNEVIIDNTNIHKPAERLYGKNDHRIIMALSIMLTKFGGIIEGVSAVQKSYPDFFKSLIKLGIEVKDVKE